MQNTRISDEEKMKTFQGSVAAPGHKKSSLFVSNDDQIREICWALLIRCNAKTE